jgi:hypothetical protein
MATDQDFYQASLLGEAMEEEAEWINSQAPPSKSPKTKKSKPPVEYWMPKMGPVGLEFMWDKTENILLHGPKGTCKSTIAVHKEVKEMHENFNNLGLMISMFHSSSTEGGVWEKLVTYVLPEWYDGIGLDFSEPKMDPKTKAMLIFVGNKFGGWSRIVLKSLPPGSTSATLTSKAYGTEPGFVLFDEIGLADDPAYFTKIAQQMRRPGIANPQFVGTCNPPELGEEHWLHDLFFKQPLEDEESAKNYKAIAVPMSENVFWTPEQIEKNKRRVMAECRFDPSAFERLIAGEWVARPVGNALFSDIFFFNKHVVGDAKNGIGLLPEKGFPLIISYDPGNVNSSISIQQLVVYKDGKMRWLWLDDIDYLGEKVMFRKLAWRVIERMKFWRETVKHPFKFVHVGDEAAINQYRASSGSYDMKEFEDVYNEVAKENGFKPDEGHDKIKIIGCPHGPGSVEARVHMTRSELADSTLLVSATARTSVSMFMHLPESAKDPGMPLKTSKWRHKFDSGTYGRFYIKTRGRSFFSYGQTSPSVIRCGGS